MSRRAVWLALIGAFVGVACQVNFFDAGYDIGFVPVELRVFGLTERAVWIRVEVVGESGTSSLERAVDDTVGSTIALEVQRDVAVSLAAIALDADHVVIQRGQIASAGPSVDVAAAVWQVTLVDAGKDPVVCDGLDNDGNGETDEDGCAE